MAIVKSKTASNRTLSKNARRTTGSKSKAKTSIKPAHKMMSELVKLYPDACCELQYETTFQLLIATILSAQTTDVSVNKVTKRLFRRFPDAQSLADGDIDTIKEIIRPTGYYNAKAANIQNCARALIEHFGGQVPNTQKQLVTLPGVGVKTANVVLGVAYGIPGWAVDTHVQRLSQRLGFTTNKDPIKIEQDLQKLFAGEDWSQLSITLIWHGRRMCSARKPACERCPINHLCPSTSV